MFSYNDHHHAYFMHYTLCFVMVMPLQFLATQVPNFLLVTAGNLIHCGEFFYYLNIIIRIQIMGYDGK